MAKGKASLPVPRSDLVKARKRASIKSWRGILYIAKWQPPRGVPKSSRQAAWVCNFRVLAKKTKQATPQEYDRAVDLAKGTTWYYRDVLVRAYSGNLITENGAHKIKTPTAKVSRSTAENVSNNTLVKLTPDQLYWDNNAFWNQASNQSRLTFRNPGLYLFGCQVQWNTNGNSYRYMTIKKNGAGALAEDICLPTGEGPVERGLVAIEYFHAADYIELFVQQNSGSTRTCLIQNFWAVAITPEDVLSE